MEKGRILRMGWFAVSGGELCLRRNSVQIFAACLRMEEKYGV
jgi:hypothetical protein